MSGGALLRAVVVHARMEVILTVRRGESLLVTVIIPAALFVFFASSKILPGSGARVAFLLPGTVTLAVISTGLVSLGIATGYERAYGVLKRLGSTPFPRVGLIAAKALSVLVFEVGQIALLVIAAAVLYGWRPGGEVWLQVLALLLGTAAFSGLGLAMAGRLRAEATLAFANALFLFFLLLGDLFVPLGRLPTVVGDLARLLPAAALADVLRSAAGGGSLPAEATVVLVTWAIAGPALAAATFRWE